MSCNNSHSPKPDLGAKSWAERERIAERFAEIDFGCDFQDGECARERACYSSSPYSYDKGRGCCTSCAFSNAYFPPESVPPAVQKYFEKDFHARFGFWREGVGCILPHRLRSATCLTYRCSHAQANAPRALLVPWLLELKGYVHSSLTRDLSGRYV